MNTHSIRESFQKGLKVISLKNYTMNPILYFFMGISLIKAFIPLLFISPTVRNIAINLYNSAPDNKVLLITIIVLSLITLALTYFLITCGLNIELIKTIMRDHRPNLNVFKLIFRKAMIKYWGSTIISMLKTAGIFILVYLALGILTLITIFCIQKIGNSTFFNGEDLKGLLLKISNNSDILIILNIIVFSLISLIITSRYSYVIFRAAADEITDFNYGLYKIKGNYWNIVKINLLVSSVIIILYFINYEYLSNLNIIINIIISLMIDYATFFLMSTQAFFFKDHIEGNANQSLPLENTNPDPLKL